MAAAALVLLGSTPYFGRLMNANERPRVLQAIALAEGQGWAIDALAEHIDPGIDVSRAPDGRLYPNKAPGTSVVAAIGVKAQFVLRGETATLKGATLWSRALTGVLPTLAFVALALIRLERRRPRGTVLAVSATLVATPLLSYGKLAYGHALSMALLYAGVSALVDAPKRTSRELWVLLGGISCALAITVEYTVAFAGVPIAALLVVRAWRSETRGAKRWLEPGLALGGVLIVLAGLLAYHKAAFGGWFETPYHHVADAGFAEIHGSGLLGLSVPTPASMREHLVSAWGGLMPWAPVIVVAFAALIVGAIRRELNEDEWVWLGIFAITLVVNLGLRQSGGWRVGPRYLVFAFPVVAHGLGYALSMGGRGGQARGLRGWVLMAIALAATTGMLSNALAATYWPHLVPVGEPVADQLVPLLRGGRSTYGLPAPFVLGAIAAILAAGLWLAVREVSPEGGSAREALYNGPQRRIVALKAGAGVLLGIVAWAPRAIGDPSIEGADLAGVIETVWEPDGPRPPADVPIRF